MKSKKMMGIVFGNIDDQLLGEMTEKRACSALPFGGRYRLIDFTLSNLVHADVSRVAVVTRSNYKSLLDHIESGKSWDLARKNGGLTVIPPHLYAMSGLNETKIQALYSILDYIDRSDEEYVALCDGNLVSNFDMKDMFRYHLDSNADVTVAYKFGSAPNSTNNIMALEVNGEGKVDKITMAAKHTECNHSLGIFILNKALLRSLLTEAVSNNYFSLCADIFLRKVNELKIMGYKIDGFAATIDSIRTYIDTNMALLEPTVRKELFKRERVVYTKIRNEMPAKYGLDSHVTNSLISDGCIIEGTVENCILFRGVKIGKGSVVRNCVLMQSTEVGDNVTLNYICTDKDVQIGSGRTLSGTESYTAYVRKGSEV